VLVLHRLTKKTQSRLGQSVAVLVSMHSTSRSTETDNTADMEDSPSLKEDDGLLFTWLWAVPER
jgi:hypothetical protein